MAPSSVESAKFVFYFSWGQIKSDQALRAKRREVSTYVCAFIFFFLMNKAACWSDAVSRGSLPAATLGMPDFIFHSFPFTESSMQQLFLKPSLPAEQPSRHTSKSSSEKKIFTYRMLMTKLFSSTHWIERNGYSPFPNGYLCWFHVPGGTAEAVARLSVLQVESLGPGRGGQPSVSSPWNSGTSALQASLGGSKPVLSAVLELNQITAHVKGRGK